VLAHLLDERGPPVHLRAVVELAIERDARHTDGPEIGVREPAHGDGAVEGVDEKSIEPLITNVTEVVAMEIQKTFDFYRATTEDTQTVVQKILISGGGSKLAGLAEELSKRLELPVEVLNPFRSINVDSRKFDPGYLNEIMPEMAVAVGLAMRGV
jgi:type IV pilus assembly protein PilM